MAFAHVNACVFHRDGIPLDILRHPLLMSPIKLSQKWNKPRHGINRIIYKQIAWPFIQAWFWMHQNITNNQFSFIDCHFGQKAHFLPCKAMFSFRTWWDRIIALLNNAADAFQIVCFFSLRSFCVRLHTFFTLSHSPDFVVSDIANNFWLCFINVTFFRYVSSPFKYGRGLCCSFIAPVFYLDYFSLTIWIINPSATFCSMSLNVSKWWKRERSADGAGRRIRTTPFGVRCIITAAIKQKW